MKKDGPDSRTRSAEPQDSAEPQGGAELQGDAQLHGGAQSHPMVRPVLIDPLVQSAVALFREAPHERWTVNEVAKGVGTSRSVLNRRFVEALKKPPLRVLREIRMNVAADLLTKSEDGLAAIADAVGYDSEFALSRAFFRHFGTRPGAFRRVNQRETTTPTRLRAA